MEGGINNLEKGIYFTNLLSSNLKEDTQSYVIPPKQNQRREVYLEKSFYDLNDGFSGSQEELLVNSEEIYQRLIVPKKGLSEPEYKGYILKKKSIDGDVTPRIGKVKQQTFSKTTSTGRSSTTATSRENDQKNKAIEQHSLNSTYQKDDYEKDKKEGLHVEDIIPVSQDCYVNKFLQLPDGEQEKQFDVIANQFYQLLKAKDFKSSNFQGLTRKMKVLRYWQAVNKDFEELNLHRLTSVQFKVVIRWVFKRIGQKMKKKERFPRKIEIVCGLGKHNNDGVSRIGPELDSFLKEIGIIANAPANNPGTRIINIRNSPNALQISHYASVEPCKENQG